MLTIAYRSRPGTSEYQYKTVITRKPPELWLADRLGPTELGALEKLEVNILYAREITDDAAEDLGRALEDR